MRDQGKKAVNPSFGSLDEFEFFDGLPKEEEYHVDESNDDLDLTLKEEEKIAPIMLFLASSLNVELVYIILTGLT